MASIQKGGFAKCLLIRRSGSLCHTVVYSCALRRARLLGDRRLRRAARLRELRTGTGTGAPRVRACISMFSVVVCLDIARLTIRASCSAGVGGCATLFSQTYYVYLYADFLPKTDTNYNTCQWDNCDPFVTLVSQNVGSKCNSWNTTVKSDQQRECVWDPIAIQMPRNT